LIAVFEYADLTITFHAKTDKAFPDTLALIGALQRDIKELFPKWGKPKVGMEVGVFCPKCNFENPPIGFLLGQEKECTRCGEKMELGDSLHCAKRKNKP